MTARTRARLLPIASFAAIVVAVAGVSAVRAASTSAPSLPLMAPEELIASTLGMDRTLSVSGRVVTRVDLGVPELPVDLGGGLAGPIAMLSGEQEFRVWRSSDGVRIAHIAPMREQVLVANRTEAWWWDSDGMVATRLGGTASPSPPGWWFGGPASSLTSPGGVVSFADEIVRRLTPFADVRSDAMAIVAGRPVYLLTLTPTSDRTLIGSVEIAVDAETHLPLRVRIVPSSGGGAAVEAGFTDVSYGPIDPAMFTFSPPPGAVVNDIGLDQKGPWSAGDASFDTTLGTGDVRVFGEGFETRLAVRLHTQVPPDVAPLLPYGGPLLSVIVAERPHGTWLLAGSVSTDTLQSDAERLP
jgi:outer membrane lipoprotein-sorting protein